MTQDLRNYFLHFGVPPIGWKIALRDNEHNTFALTLTVKELQIWKSWSEASKKYLYEAKETVDLIQLVGQHGELIDNFNKWLHAQFTNLHAADIEAVNQFINKRNAFLRGRQNQKNT